MGRRGLLDAGAPHVVEVQNRETVKNAEGLRVMQDVGPRIRVHCAVQIARDWSSAEEQLAAGLQVYDMRVIYARTWPGDVHSHIFYEGDHFEMIGAPQKSSMSKRTSHWRVTCRLIGKDEA